MKDNCGRNIEYLRVSITDRCNLRCIYCMPEHGIEKKHHNDMLRFEEIMKIIKAAASLGVKKVRFTGGEPLVVKDIDQLIHQTSKIEGINDLSITTNGVLLDDMLEDLVKAGLSRVNISLDTLAADKYKKITRVGNIDKVFSAIDKCLCLGLKPVKINTVLIRGINDNEIGDFIKLAKEMPLEIRFIELMPIGEGIQFYEAGKMSAEEVLAEYSDLMPMRSRKGSTAQLYKMKNGVGSIGFISPVSCKFCEDCNKVRLTSAGTIKPCLHSREEIDVRKHVDNELMLKAALKAAILNKPLAHHLEVHNRSESAKSMYQIGG